MILFLEIKTRTDQKGTKVERSRVTLSFKEEGMAAWSKMMAKDGEKRVEMRSLLEAHV